jgi:hypothetical protein
MCTHNNYNYTPQFLSWLAGPPESKPIWDTGLCVSVAQMFMGISSGCGINLAVTGNNDETGDTGGGTPSDGIPADGGIPDLAKLISDFASEAARDAETVSEGALNHAWDSHKYGGTYMRAKQYDNVLSPEVSSKAEFRRLVDRVISFGTRTERSANDPRGGYYKTLAFGDPGDPEIGYNGQNGLKLYFDEFGNLKSLQPDFIYGR